MSHPKRTTALLRQRRAGDPVHWHPGGSTRALGSTSDAQRARRGRDLRRHEEFLTWSSMVTIRKRRNSSSSNRCHASSNRCLTSSNKKLQSLVSANRPITMGIVAHSRPMVGAFVRSFQRPLEASLPEAGRARPLGCHCAGGGTMNDRWKNSEQAIGMKTMLVSN